MSSRSYSAVAAFVDGTYRISPAVSGLSAAIAAVHEESHGIIRRSTLFGALLARAHKAVVEQRLAGIVEHGLLSRGRTSEEVLATFQALTEAAQGDGYADAAKAELASLPEYSYYFDIGAELTAEVDVPAAKLVVLEGVIRFCWSSCHLLNCLEGDDLCSTLNALPALAYPDQRLAHIRADWSPDVAMAIREALEEHDPYFAMLRGKSFSEVFNPLHNVQLPEFSVFVDPEQRFDQLQHQMIMVHAEHCERAAAFVADRLVDRYAGTPLAGVSSAEVWRRLESWLRSLRGPIDSVGLALIEIAENLPRRRKAYLQTSVEWDKHTELPIVGVRFWQSFTANFDVGDVYPSPCVDNHEVFYAIRHRLVHSRPHGPMATEERVPIALHPDLGREASVPLAEWIPLPVIVAVWTSIILANPLDWNVKLHALANAGYKVWLVVDTEPQATVRLLRANVGEVNGFYHAPLADRKHMGGLVVRCLERPFAVLRGVVFPGRDHTLKSIVTMLRRELHDDFRGFGQSIDLYQGSLEKRHEGIALVEWLMDYEYVFSYAPSKGGHS
jgi:hypothetical protein